MQKIKKYTILNFINKNIYIENSVNPNRIFDFNDFPIKNGNIIYLCEREIRAKDNYALQFALKKSKELNLPLKIIHPKINYEYKPKQKFVDKQIVQAKNLFQKLNLNFQIIEKSPQEILKEMKIALLIIDFNPILDRNYLNNFNFKIFEIDGHNIIPARFVSDKQEYNAATLRRKIYHNIFPFLTEFENLSSEKNEADFLLEDFIKNKLKDYAQFKNNFSKNVLSGLSPYLNLGFISSQRVAIEIIKSNATQENKEAFLEELIVRKELADNFCLYCKNFNCFDCIPQWAKYSLSSHLYDIRDFIYPLDVFEKASTHDELWNFAQMQLINNGKIHGYLRMYWAKKILEWTKTPNIAIKTAIYLNDKFAFDAPSSNGYVGILWSIAGLHDRAFRD